MAESKNSFFSSKSIDFKETPAYSKIKKFIYEIDNSIKSEKQEDYVDDNLVMVDQLIDKTPLSSKPTRFSNASMADIINQLDNITNDPYFINSFGNSIRMDFGTGHELNFLCYNFVKFENNQIKLNQISNLIREYSRVIRKFVKKYNIEAAGARGCWSLDDYLLLPYLFGSSENFNKAEPLEFIQTGMFREAWENKRGKTVLDEICKLKWCQINIGLFKTYHEEVLGKSVITQHFIYSEYLPSSENENFKNVKTMF